MASHPIAIGAFAALAVLAAVTPRPAPAQHITIDGTLSTAKTLIGPNYAIGANLGKQVGGNLFHSFGLFGLATGESATFSGNARGPAISNVIGRVTGGSPSSIDGAIRTDPATLQGANLYLINPSGNIFGPNATVNVSGSFHASSADYLKMSDGAKFQATNPNGSTLSAAPPAAFGFLTASPAQISVNGSMLGPVPGTLGLVGGPVAITGATLSAPAGTIHVTSAAGTGEVPVDPRNESAPTVTSFGPVAVKGGSKIDVSDPTNLGSGGSVFIRSSALTIDASEINADNYGSGAGGTLSLSGDSQVVLSNSTSVHALARASGDGGDIIVQSLPGILSIDGSQLQTGTVAAGNSGRLTITAGALSLTNSGAAIASTFGSGTGGAVMVAANSLTLVGGARIESQSFAAGNSGNITVSIANDATLAGTGSGGPSAITATAVAGSGRAGQVKLDAGGTVALSGGARVASNSAGSGNAGIVQVSSQGPLTVVNGAEIVSRATETGAAGSVVVTTLGALMLDGMGDKSTQIAASGTGTSSGLAGSVTVYANALTIQGGAQIASTAEGRGAGGSVIVTTPGALVLDGMGVSGTRIAASATGRQSGAGGAITVQANSLVIQGGAQIASTAGGIGQGGNVSVTIAGDASVSGTAANGAASGINTSATLNSVGGAGQLSLSVGGALSVSNRAQITSSTAGQGNGGAVMVSSQGPLLLSGGGGILALALAAASGNAGSVTVTAPQIALTNGAEIASTTAGTGAGGSVTVITSGALMLDGMGNASTQIAASASGTNSGPGGSVKVTADALTVQGGAQIASSTAGPGKGGDVDLTVTSDIVLPDPGPQITARSTGSGDAGSVTVSAFRLQLGNGAGISTEAETSTASGGNITLKVGDFIYLVNSQITTSVKGETGNGGNIAIDPQFVVLSDGSSIIAQAIEGHGGNITSNAGEFLASSDSIVSATSALGISGRIEIIGPRVDLNGALVVLSSQLRSAAQVLRNSCAAQAGLPQSSLVEGGRGGLPQNPNATLPALYIAGRDMSPTSPTLPGSPPPIPTQQTTARLTMRCR